MKWFYIFVASILLVVLVSTISPIVVHNVQNYDAKIVVIDAGHGGRDVGVIGRTSGIKESEINLKLAFLIGEYLSGVGYKIVYTRTNDTQHTYPGIEGNHKRADMFARADIIKKANPHAIVSIHMNYYAPQLSRRGAQVFYDKRKQNSIDFATIMQDVINRDVNAPNGRNYDRLHADKYLLSLGEYPSIIIECGFLSNPDDERDLSTQEYQLHLASVISQGIIIYLQQDV